MLKQSSAFGFYTSLISIAIFNPGIHPAIAETDLQPQQSPVSPTAEDRATTDRVKAATSAEEIEPGDCRFNYSFWAI